MQKKQLCLSTSSLLKMSIEEQIRMFHKIGFDAFFTRWDPNLKKYQKTAERYGILYQSVHAPNENTEKLWLKKDDARDVVTQWQRCISDCAEIGVSIVVLHPWRGIDTVGIPTKEGIENFSYVIDTAMQKNIKIAIENCEGEVYLAYLLDAFSDCENVGFCWDSGHELCYNRGEDMLERHGKRLFCTHLNDNRGITSLDGKISCSDDLHLLPFDGIGDWEETVTRLAKIKYGGMLTFELKKGIAYQAMTDDCYLQEAYARAQQFATMFKKTESV